MTTSPSSEVPSPIPDAINVELTDGGTETVSFGHDGGNILVRLVVAENEAGFRAEIVSDAPDGQVLGGILATLGGSILAALERQNEASLPDLEAVAERVRAEDKTADELLAQDEPAEEDLR